MHTWLQRSGATIAACVFCLTGADVSAQEPAPAVHVVRIASGPSGTETNGTFVLTEQRASFNRQSDREIVVHFEWDGVAGRHKLAAQWHGPDGTAISTSPIDYQARDRRFGAYWRLTISPTMALGSWSVDATVDGQPAGRWSFDITETTVQGTPIKMPLTQPELYARLGQLFVPLRRIAPSGAQLEPTGAFLGSRGRIYTAAVAVDDVDRIQAVMPDGATVELSGLLAFNRRQDWAVLDGGPVKDAPIPVAAPGATKVGDRCYSLDGGANGARVLVECTITGHGPAAAGGAQIVATFLNGYGTPGAPVFNEFGELIGIVGGGGVPGATALDAIMKFRAELKGAPIVPFSQVRVTDAPARPLAELRASGELIAPLTGNENVMSGGFARGLDRSNAIAPADQRWEFARSEPGFIVFLTWNPRQRTRGMSVLRVYDADNRVVVQSKPAKIDIRKGDLKLSSWQLPMLKAAGVFRADVLIDEKPVWRGFVRITP